MAGLEVVAVKRLTAGEAARCEMARCGRCRCRCNGAHHGARRTADPAELVALPASDPHRPDHVQLALDLGVAWRQLDLPVGAAA